MKTRVGVFFGGVSVEHEVSVITALQAVQAMDDSKYEAVPVYISKDRSFYTGEQLLDIENYKDLDNLLENAQKVTLTTSEDESVLLQKDPVPRFGKKIITEIDLAFPILHGTFGEDGVMQGYFELLHLPYVGCDVLSSAGGMDKVVMKQILRDSGVPVLDYVWFYSSYWVENSREMTKMIREKLGFPVIVKPANLGSSVGINKAENQQELEESVEEAMEFSSKLLVETMVEDMKEVNCSVLGDYEEVEASVIEEVLKSEDILSYEDKYQGGNGKDGDGAKGMESTDRIIPAELEENRAKEVQELAKDTFQILGCSGVSRIDFLIDQNAGRVYVNEINTIPGSLSYYLWEPAGKDYTTLTDQLIQLALKRKRERDKLVFSIDSNLFSMQQAGGGKGSKSGTKSSS
ncbi:D-alanine--D-alanine ligase family protein [Salibacterium lacus]|uniref:D-alanine--D-alanine ligase n=1 Tax=Salibacterium lacus TaxID=1898109 RepID=A0ABW5T481_9BACI